jgi:hypothetical protein
MRRFGEDNPTNKKPDHKTTDNPKDNLPLLHVGPSPVRGSFLLLVKVD